MRSRYTNSWKRGAKLAITAGLTGIVGAFAPGWTDLSVAQACGGFFRAKTVAPEQRPSLSREKVLLIHDAAKGEEHFIREVAFVRAKEPFGFVVPTPTRPQVFKVKHTPFTKLRAAFPFEELRLDGARGGGLGGGSGKGAGVEVLEVKKVGSFTAFVLAATDEKALAKWLADNELVSTKAADAWLAHYVQMGFYYVAMRYDPPKRPRPSAAVVAETIRISFATPVPYYPYLEPQEPKLEGLFPQRLLEVWYVGDGPVIPIALQEDPTGRRQWARPLRPGTTYDDVRDQLEAALDRKVDHLLPEGPLVLQTFQDQKTSRAGFGDVLFAPATRRALDAEQAAALAPMLAILDPELAPAPGEADDDEADDGAEEAP